MITVFFILFVAFSVLYFIDIKNKTISNANLLIWGLILILIAGFRGKGLDKDYYIYKSLWMTNKLQGKVEYSFYLIRNLLKYELRLDHQYLLLTYAVLGVSLKIFAIRKISPLIWASLLIYFSNYYILHEFTQIRIGVATGFLLLSLYYLGNRKYITFYIFGLLAIFFHQSCFVVIFFPLLANSEKNIKLYYFVIPAGYLFYFFNTVLNFNIPIPSLQDKIDLYEEATKSGFMKDEKSNVFNALLLIRIAIVYIILFYHSAISKQFSSVYLLVKIYAFSIFSYIFLSKIPVFAVRVQELLGVVEIILIPCLIFILPQKFRFFASLIVWLIALVFFLMDIYYVKLINMK